MPLNKGYLTAKTDKASDEVFTPEYAVKPLLKYIALYAQKHNFNQNNPLTIWCPFDKEFSYYVKTLSTLPYVKIIYTHIDDGKNFFYYEPDNYDIIISNPPFSQKDDVLKRLYELNKPYAMLLPLPTLQGQKRFPYIKDCEALIFDKRVQYFKDIEQTEISKGASFGSIYICKDFLPNDLIFEELNRK